MTGAPRHAASRPILSAIEPQLFVADIQSSVDFYTNQVGFAVAFLHGDPPFYAQVFRDNARLNLRLVHEPVFAAALFGKYLLSLDWAASSTASTWG